MEWLVLIEGKYIIKDLGYETAQYKITRAWDFKLFKFIDVDLARGKYDYHNKKIGPNLCINQ